MGLEVRAANRDDRKGAVIAIRFGAGQLRKLPDR